MTRREMLEQVAIENVYRSDLRGVVWFWHPPAYALLEQSNELLEQLLADGLVREPPDGASFFSLTDAGADALADLRTAT